MPTDIVTIARTIARGGRGAGADEDTNRRVLTQRYAYDWRGNAVGGQHSAECRNGNGSPATWRREKSHG